MKGLTAILLSLLACLSARADVKWLEKEYNYGTIHEANGPVEGRARFVNLGPEATFVARVRPSCGCTGASYPHTMIEPGDTATITFTYNPEGRPGKFDKTVKVYIGENSQLTTLRILGTVIGKESTLDSHFPFEAGPLRLENKSVIFGELTRGANRHVFLNLYNAGVDSLTPVWKTPVKELIVESVPAVIPPGEIGTSSFYLKSADLPLGPAEFSVPLNVNGKEAGKIDVSAIIVADTRMLTAEQIDNGPRAVLLPEFVDLGTVGGTKSLPFSFDVLNEGKSTLSVEQIVVRSEGVAVAKRPHKLKTGKKGKVSGTVDLTQLPPGGFRLIIDVVTDDPLHPVRTANIVGIMEN